MVRVAGLRGQVVAGIETPSQDGLTPAEQLDRINRFVAELTDEQQECWVTLEAVLAEAGIHVLRAPSSLPTPSATWLEDHFLSHIFPVLTPIAVDPAHPFPFIPNFGFTLGLELVREGVAAHHARADADPARSSTASSACRQAKGEAEERDPLHQARDGGRHLRVAPVPGLPGQEPGRVPRAARQ